MKNLKILSTVKFVLFTSVVASVATLGMPATASAWMVSRTAKAECANNKAQVSWTFKNTEPNEAKWSMDVEITDPQTGGKTTKTVKSGETVSGNFSSDKTKLASGKVSFKMLWTDGRGGIDTRTSSYEATPECYVKPYVEPKFEAKVVCSVVDKKAVYTVNVKQTAGDDTLTFVPSNNATVANGDAVTVTGTYTQNGTSKKITLTTEKVADCNPATPVTVTPKKEDPKPQVSSASTVLPKTGAGSTTAIAGITFAVGTLLSQAVLRRKHQ